MEDTKSLTYTVSKGISADGTMPEDIVDMILAQVAKDLNGTKMCSVDCHPRYMDQVKKFFKCPVQLNLFEDCLTFNYC